MSQYNVVGIQRQSNLFLPVLHSIRWLGYSVNLFCSYRYFIIKLCRHTTSIVFPGTSQYNVVGIQRQSNLFLQVLHSITLLRYSVNLVYSYRYFIIKRCRHTTSVVFFLVRHSITLPCYNINRIFLCGSSQYNVVGIQRQSNLFLPVRHSITWLRWVQRQASSLFPLQHSITLK